MTGTASSKGKIFMDFDSYKNQEWLRRRKLRLEQVRKQSSEIARALRQKVSDEEKRRLAEYERMREEEFRMWKAEKLEELEQKLMSALEGFGAGHRLAEEEASSELELEEKNKVNFLKAQKRGEIAHQEELKRNRLAKEHLLSSIERKKMTRKREDLRSALIRTVPIKKQMIDMQEVSQETNQPGKHKISLMKKKIKRHNDKGNASSAVQKKVPAKNVWKKKQVNHRSYGCACRLMETQICPAEGVETVWINLDEMQTLSAGESGAGLKSSRSAVDSSRKCSRDRSKGSLEFYDFSSRYYCKSFKELPHLVERISHDAEELNANQLAKAEEEMERVEATKKQEIDAASRERGAEALRKEKVIRDYNNLMTKLEELSKKEKILKTQQRDPPSFLHMNDERLSQRTKTRQRIMESKFESVYYEAIARIPRIGVPTPEPPSGGGGGDHFEAGEGPTTRLSFSASNLKHNTPAASSSGQFSGGEATPPETTRRPERTTSQRRLLMNISNALREGRELRKRISRNWERNSSEGEERKGEESSNSDSEETKARSVEEESLGGSERTPSKCQESQTEDPRGVEEEREDLRLRISDKEEDDSLPVSTSTSYKSPPSVIRCHRLQQFLDYLEGLSETEEQHLAHCSPKLKSKVNTILCDLLHEEEPAKSEEEKERKHTRVCPSLEFYIEKLLNMSRECIANLSVSSENISTPNMTDLDARTGSEAPDSECPSRRSSNGGEDLVRKSRLKRADTLDNSIRNWKMILEKMSDRQQREPEDVPDCPHGDQVERDEGKSTEPPAVISSPNIKSRYDEISKKCSERILELSDMLDKVRKDKEKLLSSGSGGSSLNLSKSERNSGKGFVVEEAEEEDEEEDEEEVVPVRRMSAGTPKTSPVLDGFINRYNLTRPREETVSTTAVADSQSLHDLNESLESWPDVMDELLKREILTSPFKWSDGELSSELTTVNDNRAKPSSIESVIGNFRKEIDKIKPFSLTAECSRTSSPSKPRRSTTDGEERKLCWSPEKRTSGVGSGTESEQVFREESSVESINHYLTSLGLNWAKSFLRKNAESRAMSSSSNSEKKSSGDEEEN